MQAKTRYAYNAKNGYKIYGINLVKKFFSKAKTKCSARKILMLQLLFIK